MMILSSSIWSIATCAYCGELKRSLAEEGRMHQGAVAVDLENNT